MMDYTRFAQRFAARYPLISYITIHVNFWVLANLLLTTIIYLAMLVVEPYLPQFRGYLGYMYFIALMTGLVYGFFQASVDRLIIEQLDRKRGLGSYLAWRLLFSVILNVLLFYAGALLGQSVFGPRIWPEAHLLGYRAANYILGVYLIYYFIMNILLIFIDQMNLKFGPGILLPMLFGKYSTPVEEERVFLFMDLTSSTTLAETLGHLKYSAFIRDSFKDINQLIPRFEAEIYQYVGDEIVLSWRVFGPDSKLAGVRFFFACEELFTCRSGYYLKNYGTVPVFKAGIQGGSVTAVEIGDIKRDIAYHGDVLNTAARLQSLCNEQRVKLLATAEFAIQADLDQRYDIKMLGQVQLKGRSAMSTIVSIDQIL